MNDTCAPELKLLLEIAEMKRIYSALESAALKEVPKCIAVTSAVSGEGKTIMTAGLAALTACEKKMRVLAIDMNWHAPALHTYFGIQPVNADQINDASKIEELIKPSGIANLDILSALQSNNGWSPAAQRESADLIIKNARAKYAIVFIDTSRIFPANRHMIDPIAIAKKVDGVALVVSAHDTPRQQVKQAHMLLGSVGANTIGLVLNQGKSQH